MPDNLFGATSFSGNSPLEALRSQFSAVRPQGGNHNQAFPPVPAPNQHGDNSAVGGANGAGGGINPNPGNTGIVPPSMGGSPVPAPGNPGNPHMGGFGGFGGGGFFPGFMGHGKFGFDFSQLQLPTDMTAGQLLENLKGLNFRDLRHDYKDSLRDWRHGDHFGAQPLFGATLAAALGGTYGPAAQAQAQAQVASGATTAPATIAPGEPAPAAVAPVSPAPSALDQNFYQTHGYYPGQGA